MSDRKLPVGSESSDTQTADETPVPIASSSVPGNSHTRATSSNENSQKNQTTEEDAEERVCIRTASIVGVPAKSIERSTYANTSNGARQQGAGGMNSGGPFEPGSFPNQLPLQMQPQVKKTFSGRHRQSGLFSLDDMSIDVSPTASQVIRPLPQGDVRRQSGVGARVGSAVVVKRQGSVSALVGSTGVEKIKHPISVAGSSIGSASLGSASGEYLVDVNGPHRRHAHRPFRRRWRRFRRKYKGCIFALLSSFTSSLASYFVHMLTTRELRYDATYCLLWRYIGVLFPGIFIVIYYRCCNKEMIFDTIWPLGENERIKRFGLSVVRSIVDVVAVLLNYYAFENLGQSETSTILNSKPVVVQLLAHFTLGEPWGVVPIVMSIFAAVGILIISKPPFLEGKEEKEFGNRLEGVGFAVGSMLLAAVVYVILRYLKDVHYSVFSLFIGTVGIILGLGLCTWKNTFILYQLSDLGYLIVLASLVCCSSISIVIALQNEEAFVVSLVRSFDVIFSFIWEISLKRKYPDWYRGGGACIIIFCVLVIFFRKYISHQDPNSKLYKRFHFLTK